MDTYAWFSTFYDASVERLYVEARRQAAEALGLRGGERVLDLPCGTGQSFPALLEGIGATGTLVAADRSPAMLAKARARAGSDARVRCVEADVTTLDADALGGPVDAALVFLGMSVFPEPDAAFARIWAAVRPGGRVVVVDVHSARPSLQGRLVNAVAGAEIQRRSWEPLERRAAHFERRTLSTRWEHGGELFLARGEKPAAG